MHSLFEDTHMPGAFYVRKHLLPQVPPSGGRATSFFHGSHHIIDAIEVLLNAGTVPVRVVGESQKGQKRERAGAGAVAALTLRMSPPTNAPAQSVQGS